MKTKKVVTFLIIPLAFVVATGYFYTGNSNEVSAQSIVTSAADKAVTNSKIEYIKETLSDGSYTVRIRDRENLTEVTEEYRNDKLHTKMIIEDKGKKITSIGRDIETGKLVGRTWTMPETLSAENEKLLEISLLEKQKEELQSKSWTVVEPDSRSLTDESDLIQAVTEDDQHKEIVTIDEETGLPIKREIFVKDKDGNIIGSQSSTEEYKYLDSAPNKIHSLTSGEEVDIQGIEAPIVEDKVLGG
ncbi:hypothetical protein NSU18_15665 [Paenibacillus sp. FSL H8-0048]|uniref:hypothetical protein n=1 Tax=Paenibacillus sp. FSL H8-0048 TaxID=2954508 RepID=UPI0030F7DE26